MAERPATRLYLPEPLEAGASVVLTAATAHRLWHVLRLSRGAAVAAFNERDGEWLCRIVPGDRNATALVAERQLRPPEPAAGPWLAFAPIKRARLDWLVEKASELGVGLFLPVRTRRTTPERLNLERLRALGVAAAEQSERLSIPDFRPLESLESMVAQWPADRLLLWCDESGGGVPVAEALRGLAPGPPAGLLVGPEGGFAETELDALRKLPIVTRVGLGPRVLRAETAALAALSVFQAIAGDWRRPRSR
jgi:16S rRNA (uracil1498-N3)-methyltransferase